MRRRGPTMGSSVSRLRSSARRASGPTLAVTSPSVSGPGCPKCAMAIIVGQVSRTHPPPMTVIAGVVDFRRFTHRPSPASVRRPRRRSSTPSNSFTDMSDPTKPMLSTGRTATTSAGNSRASRATRPPGARSAGPAGPLDEVGRPVEVPGDQGVADRLGRGPRRGVPVAGTPVQLGDVLGPLVEQARVQHVGEEVVVAVPAPRGRRAGTRNRLPRSSAPASRLPSSRPGDRVAERAAQPVEDRGLEQELPDRRPAAGQHLLGEVVDDVAVVRRRSRR